MKSENGKLKATESPQKSHRSPMVVALSAGDFIYLAKHKNRGFLTKYKKHLHKPNKITTFAAEMSHFIYEYATNTIIIRYGIG